MTVRRTCFLLKLCVGLLSVGALAASAATPQTGTAQGGGSASGGRLGAEGCVTCHGDLVKEFGSNPHSRMSVGAVVCETCHGPGKDHVDAKGDKTKIWNPINGRSQDGQELCVSCHKDQHPEMDRSAHAKGEVNCLGCHDIHKSKAERLLKEPESTLCYQCHADVREGFSMPVHHQVNEGILQCSDCHDPHEASQHRTLESVGRQNAACMKCHTGTAGPWAFEHSAVKSEGCVACHTPHGGANPHFLKKSNVSSLCLECHSPAQKQASGVQVNNAHRQDALRQACTTCHVGIHGSNHSEFFLRGPE